MSGEANSYVAELRAENARLREVVRRVEGVAERLDDDADSADQLAQDWLDVGSHADRDRCIALADDRRENAERLREALGSTDTGPAPAGAYSGAQGAGDGV